MYGHMAVFLFVAAFALFAPASERFVGGLMGVRADVTLCMATQHATISLQGMPLGGRLQGTARFSGGEGSCVVVDEPLKSQLSRRFVSIASAELDRVNDRVYVVVRLPFLIGTQRIVLGRAEGDIESPCESRL